LLWTSDIRHRLARFLFQIEKPCSKFLVIIDNVNNFSTQK